MMKLINKGLQHDTLVKRKDENIGKRGYINKI